MDNKQLVWESSQEMLEQLPKGAFLTLSDGERMNVMTIAWGSIGFIWGKPVFTTLVRYSRYSYDLIEKSGEFGISIPAKETLKQELAFCGSKSGRDLDKFQGSGLTPVKGRIISAPSIKECSLHLECKVLYKQGMNETFLDPKVKDISYPNGDLHVMYFGEIVACY
ncbi:MAG: flavin reductase family protein [Bacillota bacterium]|jgi:flavin reductase (DIM6/NTAB) family NADH-FMN oxidoreductase RutF